MLVVETVDVVVVVFAVVLELVPAGRVLVVTAALLVGVPELPPAPAVPPAEGAPLPEPPPQAVNRNTEDTIAAAR